MIVNKEAIVAELRSIGYELRRINDARASIVEVAKERALEAHDIGVTEVELAELLGVDRARTIRRWLGKAK